MRSHPVSRIISGPRSGVKVRQTVGSRLLQSAQQSAASFVRGMPIPVRTLVSSMSAEHWHTTTTSCTEGGAQPWDVERSGTDSAVHEREWQRLVEQIRNGDCTPFLGAGACSGTLPLADELSRIWADHYDYPFGSEATLPEVMQYASVIERDFVTVKQRVVDQLSGMGQPDFTNVNEPHAMLAKHPISVYLTTNYDDYMTRALRLEGKEPTTRVCPWYRGSKANPLPRGYQPTVDQPLVYHLHGNFDDPASLVLAEEDYVEFLVNLVMDRGMDDQRVVPVQVLPALTRQPLLFIGYSLRDWSFRMLFHGLVKAVADVQRRRHVSVQLTPSTDESDADAQRRAEAYLTDYFQLLNISVFWGTSHDFCAELGRRLGE